MLCLLPTKRFRRFFFFYILAVDERVFFPLVFERYQVLQSFLALLHTNLWHPQTETCNRAILESSKDVSKRMWECTVKPSFFDEIRSATFECDWSEFWGMVIKLSFLPTRHRAPEVWRTSGAYLLTQRIQFSWVWTGANWQLCSLNQMEKLCVCLFIRKFCYTILSKACTESLLHQCTKRPPEPPFPLTEVCQ